MDAKRLTSTNWTRSDGFCTITRLADGQMSTRHHDDFPASTETVKTWADHVIFWRFFDGICGRWDKKREIVAAVQDESDDWNGIVNVHQECFLKKKDGDHITKNNEH